MQRKILAMVALSTLFVVFATAHDRKEDISEKVSKEEFDYNKLADFELASNDDEVIPLPSAQTLKNSLANPNVIYVLLLLGLLGIFIEFQAPGLIVPAVFGAICLTLVFGVQTLAINWFGAALIFLALIAFIAEIFITSFGILMLAGLALLISGSYLLFAVPGSTVFVEPFLIWLFSGLLTLLMIIVGILIIRAKRQGPTANVDALVGSIAQVSESISKDAMGQVLLNGSYWRARALKPIERGASVRITKVNNTILWVEKISEE